MPHARTVSELQADLLAAYQNHDEARAATHAARVAVGDAQSRESVAADAVVLAEKALASALESEAAETP
jgi:hypothetical protein